MAGTGLRAIRAARANGKGSWPYLCLFAAIFILLVTLVRLYELDYRQQALPWWTLGDPEGVSFSDVRLVFAALCAFVVLGVVVWAAVRRSNFARSGAFTLLVKLLLLLAVFASAMNYFYVRPGLAKEQFAHRHDIFHYFLHPRYYAEMDYADLYTCVVEAAPTAIVPDSRRVRDLRTYRMTTAGKLRERKLCPREDFSPERWRRLRQDIVVLAISHNGHKILHEALRDRGYNGTPLHAALSGTLADRLPFTPRSLNQLGLLDAFFICAMLASVVFAFGYKTGLLFSLSVFLIAADRWMVTGGAWFRYAWYLTLVLGFVALRRERYGWAGGWLALSSLLNVFPVLFTAGVVLRGLADWYREGRLRRRYLHFAIAGTLTGVIGLGIGAAHARHLDNYSGWIENMTQHNTERFQGFGVGLKFGFIYRGAHTSATDDVPESERRALFHERRAAYYVLAALLIALAVAIAVRTRDDVEASAILGFTLMFVLFGTVGYYFACASLVVLGLHRRLGTAGGAILLALWFAASGLAHWALYETGYHRFMYNTVISITWSVWLVLALVWLASRLGLLSWLRWKGAPPGVGKTP